MSNIAVNNGSTVHDKLHAATAGITASFADSIPADYVLYLIEILQDNYTIDSAEFIRRLCISFRIV